MTQLRAPVLSGVVAALLLVCVIGRGAPARAGDDPNEMAVRTLLVVLEELIQRIDGARARGGAYGNRVWDLHVRLSRVEESVGLPTGATARGSGFAGWLATCNLLGHRARAVLLARAEHTAPTAKVPDQGLFEPAPQDSGAPPPPPPSGPSADKGYKWPERLSFKATAKINYLEKGEWLLGPRNHSSWGPDFLQTGYEGAIAVSVRARDLPRELKSADMRVVVRVLHPFATAGGWRVIDVTWQSERSLSNQALKTWPTLDRLTIPGPYRWVNEPEKHSAPLDVEAHVRSVTLHDGTKFHFPVPEYAPVKPQAPAQPLPR